MSTRLAPMSKTEARTWLARLREDIRDAEQALKDGDAAALVEAMMDASGAAETLRGTVDEPQGWDEATEDYAPPRGIRGMA